MRVFSSMNSVVVHKVRFIFAWYFIFLEMEEYTLHRGAYDYGSNKSTRKETGKTHLCALVGLCTRDLHSSISKNIKISFKVQGANLTCHMISVKLR